MNWVCCIVDSYSSESFYYMKKVFTKRDTCGRIDSDLVQRSLYLQDAYEWEMMEMRVCTSMQQHIHHVYTVLVILATAPTPLGMTQLYWMYGYPIASWPNSLYSSCLHHIQLPSSLTPHSQWLQFHPTISVAGLSPHSQWLQSYHSFSVTILTPQFGSLAHIHIIIARYSQL